MEHAMDRMAIEYDILETAIDAIHREAGLQLDVIGVEVLHNGKRIDALILEPKTGAKFTVEIKNWANHANVGAVINQINYLAEPGKGMLVADYINPKMSKRLKEADIQFIDAAGNAYINQQPIYIYIKGNKRAPEGLDKEKTKTGRAFQPTGLKVLFAFLKDRELINAPYREIAKQAKVALGTVGWVINDLVAQGIILEGIKKNERKLADFEQLLDKWVEAYPHKLKEKQRIGTFTTEDPEWWKEINPLEFNALWGGEVAAAEYTDYLTPKNAVVYINKADMAKFLRVARLRRLGAHEHPEIRVDLIEKFWKEEQEPVKKEGLVHPIVTYADLVETGDPRNLDTANRLREKYIR